MLRGIRSRRLAARTRNPGYTTSIKKRRGGGVGLNPQVIPLKHLFNQRIYERARQPGESGR